MTDYFRYKSYPPVQIEESGNTYTYFLSFTKMREAVKPVIL